MSTRSNIHFTDKGSDYVAANIYRHSDGYPENVLPDLDKFFADVAAQTTDTRFSDPEYLAAKFVVWQALRESGSDRPLGFLGVGIMTQDAGDAAYIYTVACHPDGPPVVSYCEA
jgi:hypothetical protein